MESDVTCRVLREVALRRAICLEAFWELVKRGEDEKVCVCGGLPAPLWGFGLWGNGDPFCRSDVSKDSVSQVACAKLPTRP